MSGCARPHLPQVSRARKVPLRVSEGAGNSVHHVTITTVGRMRGGSDDLGRGRGREGRWEAREGKREGGGRGKKP